MGRPIRRLSCSFWVWIGIVHLEQLVFRLDELRFDIQQVGLQRDPLHDLLIRLAIELLQEVDGRL